MNKKTRNTLIILFMAGIFLISAVNINVKPALFSLKIDDETACICNAYPRSNEFENKIGENVSKKCLTMSTPPDILYPYNPSPKPNVLETPDYFNWKDLNGQDWTTSARDQQDCGSCWAFAAVSALESIINIQEGTADLDPDLSEQYILSCLPKSGNCTGGSPYLAFQYIKSSSPEGNGINGIIPENCFPYQANDLVPCNQKCTNWQEELIPIESYGYWIPNDSFMDKERIKTQVMNEGPVVAHIMATDDFKEWGWNNHKEESYYAYPDYVSGSNHCIIIIGWKDETSIPQGGYWICKNSWGTYWGYEGFFNIEYGALNVDTTRIDWVKYDSSSFDWEPIAITSGPYQGGIDKDILFDGSDSHDPEGSIKLWYWDFGDGMSGSGKKVTHSYTKRGLYNITLTVTDYANKTDYTKTVAFIDTWIQRDTWCYNVKEININIENNLNFHLKSNINNLKLSVANDEYLVTYTGRINGDFEVASLQPPMDLSGRMFLVFANGTIDVDRTFQLKNLFLQLNGIFILKIEGFFIPIPLPFHLEAVVESDSILSLFNFPLEIGKIWDVSTTRIKIDCAFSTLIGTIKVPFQYEIEPGTISLSCTGKKLVTVEAGQYDAYEITYSDFIRIYYAHEVENIIKISGVYDENSFYAELKNTNFGY